MNIPRLTELIAVLRAVPDHTFDIYKWFDGQNPDTPECGTVACAAGWACLHKPFQLQGLRLVADIGNHYMPKFNRYDGFRALERFFGLSEAEAWYLFSPDHYPDAFATPSDVIARIEELLA